MKKEKRVRSDTAGPINLTSLIGIDTSRKRTEYREPRSHSELIKLQEVIKI